MNGERDDQEAERPGQVRSAIEVTRLAGPHGYGLSIDVEEWFHTCLEPDYVDPARRPPLPHELDRLLPELLELLDRHRRRATFFVLGEVARLLPRRVRELAAAGHEVASHGYHHLRVSELSPRRFRRELEAARALLEDLSGAPVTGYRAPEWSLREVTNPRLSWLAELGYRYDSSLTPALGSGRRSNPQWASTLSWPGGASLVELPPLTYAGALRLPAGGWTGRLVGERAVIAAARAHHAAGGLPVLVVHPWELADRPVPGELTGVARWVHELGRIGYRAVFARLLAALPWTSLGEALSAASASAAGSERGEPAERDSVGAEATGGEPDRGVETPVLPSRAQ